MGKTMWTKEIKPEGKTATALGCCLLLMVLAEFIFCLHSCFFDGSGSSQGGNTHTSGSVCGVCGKTFTDADNMHSITMKGMCKNCFANYEAGMAMTGRDADGNYINGQ